MLIIRIFFLFVAIIGNACFLKKKFKVNIWFLPVVLLSSIGLSMYVAGLLNFMPLMVGFIVAWGGGTLLYYRKEFKWEKNWLFPLVCFLGIISYLVWYCYDAKYADGDTMTHWGVVVRDICLYDRLPNFSNKFIAYQSYPTGAAGLIYFFCKLLGYCDGTAMFAQGLYIAACLLALFALVDKDNIFGYIICIFVMVYALQYNITLDDLKVDNLLGLLVLACLAIAFYYCKSDFEMAIYQTAPLLCMMQIIKNSGIIFWLFSALLLVNYAKRNRKDFKKCLIFSVALPLSMLFLWNCHLGMVYLDAEHTRHSASISNLLSVIQQRPVSEYQIIVSNFGMKWFSWDASGEWAAWLTLIVALIIGGCLKKSQKVSCEVERRVFVSVMGAYLLHKASLLGMYMFNMPDSDALGVGGYARYMDSVSIIIYGIAAIYLISCLASSDHKKRITRLTSLTVVLVLLILPITDPSSLFALNRPDYMQDGVYRKLRIIQSENNLPERDGKVLVYSHKPFAGFFANFCFWSVDTYAVDIEGLQRGIAQNYYEYLIVLDHDEAIDAKLTAFGFPVEEDVIYLKDYFE